MPGIELPFPLGGLNDGYAHSSQPPQTTRDAENVRSVDPTTNRERGAQRPGYSKFCSTRIGIGTKVQAAVQVTYDARATTYSHASGGDLTVWAA